MQTTRRTFLASTSAALALGGTLFNNSGTILKAATGNAQPFRTKLYKALIGASPTDEICEAWKKAGFEGMEVTNWNVSPAEAQKARLIAEKHDFYLHSVMRGWAEFNNKDESLAKKSIEDTKTAIRAAAAYGAETVLLVPCRVGGMKMPEAWNFDIGFDPLTLVVKTVTSGDNS